MGGARPRLRTATLADTPNVVPLLNAAYGESPTFEARFRAYVQLEPGGWVVIEGPEGPVGVGGFVRFGACAYIGLMGVAPLAQRTGLGSMVFEELLRRCDALGVRLLLLDATEKGAALYQKYGFEDHGKALAYQIDAGLLPVAEGAAGVRIEPLRDADEPAVAAIDAAAYGADRTALLGTLLREYAGRAFVARGLSGALVGYAIGQSLSFGPCVAPSAGVACALARTIVALPYPAKVTWLVADQNAAAIGAALSLGGVVGKTWRHLRRGSGYALASDWSNVFAKATLAVG